MPGISQFSNEELADRLFTAIKAEAATVKTLKDAMERIAEFADDDEGMDGDELAGECVAIARHALKAIGESAYDR